ncbi:hypothetical protein BC833DRAFT_353307 [Globomyces pollinis-pini]|nr:hypothetical protein BC833DRAFT_353307 [Globomyces pollinis-pini]
MILFNVLNEDTTPIDLTINTDKELHVEELLVQYTNAISEENAEIRKNKLEIILKHEFLMERLDSIGNIQDSPIHTLQYCVFKNFASLLNDKEALIYYKKAVTLDPTAIDLLLKIAAIYEREGYLSSAYRYYVKCLDFDLIDQQQKSIMIKVALILFKYGLFADAMAWANKVLQMDSQDLTCLAIKAYIVEECYQSQSQIRLFDLNMNQIEIIRFQKNKEMIPTLERPILNGNQAIIPLKSKPINVKLDTTLSVLSLELLKLMIHVFHFTNDNDDNEKPENGVIHVKLVQNQDGSADMDCSSSNPDIEKLDIISIASSSDIAESQTQNANSKKLSNPLKVPDAKMEITNDALTANATKENDATLELDKVVKLEIDENGEPIDSVIDSIKLEDDGEGIQSVSKKRKLSIAGEEKRSSNRVKKLLMADETPEVVEPISYSVFENLLELNSILPDDKQFTEFGSNIKSFIKDPEGLIQRISKELVSKASTKKQTQQSHFQIQYSAWMQTQNEQHPFFNSTDLCEEFCSNLITSVGTLPNILFELIKFLIESSIVSKRWCASLSYISYTIIQITNQLSDSLATYISSISDSKNDDWEVLMIITEILFESLLDHTGKNYLEESNDELNGLDTINPLNKSSKKALFNKCLVKLNYIVQSNECDVLFLIRFFSDLTSQILLAVNETRRAIRNSFKSR